VKKPDIQQAYQAGSYLICVFLAWQITSGLEGTEFSGGWLTGPLLSMEDTGTALFIVSVVLTFVFLRVAAPIGLASSVLCLPICFLLLRSHSSLRWRTRVQGPTSPGISLAYVAGDRAARPRCYALLLHSACRSH
jgi:hypothetical protein